MGAEKACGKAGATSRCHFRRGGDKLGNQVLPYLIDAFVGTTRTTTLKRKLDEAEKKIPIAEILNHEGLLIQISKGWKPEWESDDLAE